MSQQSSRTKKDHFFSLPCAIFWIGCLFLLIAAIAWKCPQRGPALIDLLKIFVSWPFVIAILGFSFGTTFRTEIATYIKYVRVKLPDGTTVLSQQEPAESEASDPSVMALTKEDQEKLSKFIGDLQQKAEATHGENKALIEEAKRLLEEKQNQSVFWFFEYLNLFLVPMTKQVLTWFSQQMTGTTKPIFDSTWTPILLNNIPERDAIFLALIHYELIQETGSRIQITNAGRQFLQHLATRNNPAR